MYYELYLKSKIVNAPGESYSKAISAIKALRVASGCGLKEAKDVIDCKKFPSLLMRAGFGDEPFDPIERAIEEKYVEKIKALYVELLDLGLDVELLEDDTKVTIPTPNPLDRELNLYLDTFYKKYSYAAQRDKIEDCVFKEIPRSRDFEKFKDSPAHPLYELAVQIDNKIYNERIELCSSSASNYVVGLKKFFMDEDSKRPDVHGDCPSEGCKGKLEKRKNGSTGVIYYSCTEWPKGCRISINKDGELSEFSKEYAAKLVSKACPKCSRDLMKKTAAKGKYAGKQFIGCSGWPSCTYTESLK